MSALRTYELVYIVTPDATEEQIASIHEQVEQTTQRMGGLAHEDRELGPAQARLRDQAKIGRAHV